MLRGFWWGNPKERGCLEEYRRIILKWVSNRTKTYGLDSPGSDTDKWYVLVNMVMNIQIPESSKNLQINQKINLFKSCAARSNFSSREVGNTFLTTFQFSSTLFSHWTSKYSTSFSVIRSMKYLTFQASLMFISHPPISLSLVSALYGWQRTCHSALRNQQLCSLSDQSNLPAMKVQNGVALSMWII
jgi:hypothetical protein